MSNNMTEEKKNELLLKAAVKFKGVWPSDDDFISEDVAEEDNRAILYTHTWDNHYPSEDVGHISLGGVNANKAYYHIITRAEFEAFVELLFKDAPEDATHYSSRDRSLVEVCLKQKESVRYFIRTGDSEWIKLDAKYTTEYFNLIPRPPKKRDAEWMPAVGQEWWGGLAACWGCL